MTDPRQIEAATRTAIEVLATVRAYLRSDATETGRALDEDVARALEHLRAIDWTTDGFTPREGPSTVREARFEGDK